MKHMNHGNGNGKGAEKSESLAKSIAAQYGGQLSGDAYYDWMKAKGKTAPEEE